MEILRLEKLRKEYGEGDTKVVAVNDVDLVVEQGEFVIVVGCSGSGKSTLLNLIGGIDTPTSGRIYIEGKDISEYKDKQMAEIRRKKIGIIFQSYNLIPVLTVEENIKMPVLLDRKKPDKQYMNELIDLLGLTERINHLPNQLSGGQQQRVSIGRSLANKPPIILADEPTGNLDKNNTMEVMNLLKTSAKRYNQTVILITHESDITSFADRIIEIEDGKIISDKVQSKA